MVSNEELKRRGLEFGRTLQRVFKQCSMYSSEHPAVQPLMEQAFAALSELFSVAGPVTFGFAEGRLLINNVLTSDASLRSLNEEFSRRGVGALVLAPMLDAGRFKQLIVRITVRPKLIVESGGAEAYFQRVAVEGARVILAAKRDSQQDTVLTFNSEKFVAQGGWSPGLQSDASVMINLEALLSAAGSEGTDVQRQIQVVVESAMLNPELPPGNLVPMVCQIIDRLGAPAVRAAIPSETKVSATSSPPEVASYLVTEVALRWAVGRLAQARSQSDIVPTYEEVLAVLVRALQSAALIQRVLDQLARLAEEKQVAKPLLELIRQELDFSLLPLRHQKAAVLKHDRYSETQFRRLTAVIRALLEQHDVVGAMEVAQHYMQLLSAADLTSEQLARLADLFRVFASAPPNDFARALRCVLSLNWGRILDPESHRQAVQLLGMLGQLALRREDWEGLQEIVKLLEAAPDRPEDHECCRSEKARLEQQAELDRTLDSSTDMREDAAVRRARILLLRAFGIAAAEKALQRLENEADSGRRMRLVRVIAQLGDAAIRVTRQRLSDPRWYVVRNACLLLGDLRDAELLAHLRPALSHSDERVQMAAVRTLQRRGVRGREQVLSEELKGMAAPVVEVVLDDLMLLRNPTCLLGLRDFILEGGEGRLALVVKALQLVATLASSQSRQLLMAVLSDECQAVVARRAAMLALHRGKGVDGESILERWLLQNPMDPLAEECRQLLASRQN